MDREKVMTWLEICGKNRDCSGCCPYSENGDGQCRELLMADAYELLKEQEHKDKMFHALEEDWKTMLKEQDEEHRRLLSWLGKFCRHIDNGDAWLTDEENIAFFKEKMKQQFGWDTD